MNAFKKIIGVAVPIFLIVGSILFIKQSNGGLALLQENIGLSKLFFVGLFLVTWLMLMKATKTSVRGGLLASAYYSAAPVAMFAILAFSFESNPIPSVWQGASQIERISSVNSNHFLLNDIKRSMAKGDVAELDRLIRMVESPIDQNDFLQLRMLNNALSEESSLKTEVSKWLKSGIVGKSTFNSLVSKAINEPDSSFVSRKDLTIFSIARR